MDLGIPKHQSADARTLHFYFHLIKGLILSAGSVWRDASPELAVDVSSCCRLISPSDLALWQRAITFELRASRMRPPPDEVWAEHVVRRARALELP